MFENLTSSFQSLFGRLTGRGRITESNVRDALREVRMALLEADVSLPVVRDFIARVKEKALGEDVIKGVDPGQMFIKILNDELRELMGGDTAPLNEAEKPPTVILMAGLQGSGKTTTCGKLALHLKKQGKSVLLVAGDLQRPAAVDQLEVIGGQVDVPVHADRGAAPPDVCAAAVQRAREEGHDVVILDTAGRLHVDEELMAEVAQVAGRTSPHEIFLVLDSMTGQDAVNSAKAFNERLELTGVVLTKLDGDARGGAALSVRAVTGKPIKFVGLGEKLEKLDVFHADRMAERILGMGDVVSFVEKAQDVIDEEEANRQAEKMFLGSFTLEDFLGLLQKVRSMGPLKELMGMIPGVGAQVQNLQLDEKQFDRSQAIIQSMTPKERHHPEIINVSRRGRIARGSGTDQEQVTALLKNFKQMRKQIQQMRRMGVLGGMLDPSRGVRKGKQRELDRMRRMGVNPLDVQQVKAFKAHQQRQERRKARKDKNRKKKKR